MPNLQTTYYQRVNLRLTPSQLLDIYKQIIKKRKKKEKDWITEPAMLAMLEEEASRARGEYEQGDCVSVDKL